MAKFQLARAAYTDLEDIEAHTERHWGKAQCVAYIESLWDVFEKLGENPRMGTERRAVRVGLFAFPHQLHVIYYRLKDGACFIVRVLHSRRDAKRHV